MAVEISYEPIIESIHQEGVRLASSGDYPGAKDELAFALSQCSMYTDKLTGDTHKARVRRDMGAVGARAALAEARVMHGAPNETIWQQFHDAQENASKSYGDLSWLRGFAAERGASPATRNYLQAETGASATWLSRIHTAWAVLDPVTRQHHLEEARQHALDADRHMPDMGNEYYQTSLYTHMARLAILRGHPARSHMLRAGHHVVAAWRYDRPNFRPAARTYLRTFRTIFSLTGRRGRVKKIERAIRQGAL